MHILIIHLLLLTALQTVRKAMTHIYYGVENGWLRLSLWAARAGSPFSTPKSAVASFPHRLSAHRQALRLKEFLETCLKKLVERWRILPKKLNLKSQRHLEINCSANTVRSSRGLVSK